MGKRYVVYEYSDFRRPLQKDTSPLLEEDSSWSSLEEAELHIETQINWFENQNPTRYKKYTIFTVYE